MKSYVKLWLVLDAVDEKDVIIILTLLMRWSQRRFGVQRGEAQEHESFHQVSAVGTLFLHAKHNAVAVQLLFGELQKRQERLLAGFVRQRLRQSHIQDVVVMVQDLKWELFFDNKLHNKPKGVLNTHRVPAWWNLISDIELDGEACWWFLCNDLRDETVLILALAVSVILSTSTVLLVYLIFNLFVDEWQLMISSFRVVSVRRVLRDGIEGCLASVINYKWRLIVIGSLFCNYIRSTTAAPLRAWRNTRTTTPTNCWRWSRCACYFRSTSLNPHLTPLSFYYFSMAHCK